MARKNVQPPQPRGVHNKETRAIVQKHVEGIIQSSAKVADLQFRNVALQTKYAVMSEGVKEKEHKVAVQTAVLTLSLLSVPGQSFSSNDKLKKMSDEEKQLINDLNTENITRQAAMLDQSTARIDPSIGNLSEKTQDQLKSLQDELSSPTGRFATLNPVQRETLKQNVALAQRMQENASNETPFTIKNQKDLQKLITQNDMSALQIDKSIGNLSLKSEESLQELKQKITSGTGKYQNLSSTERKELTTRVDFALKTKDKKSSLAKSLKAGRKTDFSGRKIKGVMSMVATAAIATSDDQTIRGMRNMKSMAHMSKMMKGVAVETGKISYMFAKASILGTANYASMGLKLAGKTDAAEKIKNFETKWNNTEGFVTKTIPGKITEHKQTKRAHKAQKKEERNVRVRAVGARISNTRMARPIVNVSRGVRVKAAQFANTKGGKAVIKVGKVGKSAIRMPFKAVNVMSKVFQVFTNTAEALKQLALTLVKKLAVKILVPIISSSLPVVTQVLMFFAPIICLMFVTAAISDSLTEFKEHTSMGAAYDKLLDKEAQFSAAILSTVDHANGSSGLTIPQNIQDEYGITSFTATDAKYIDGNGNETSNTSTIKQILSMAAVYIEQDFDKYGAFLDGTLTDSVYKDYCAKLYDSSHIIAYAEPDYDESEIYYCLNESDGEGASYVETATKKPAMIDCNNKSDSTICYVNEYTTTAEIEEDKRKYTCVVRETDNVSNNGNSGHEKHTYTPIQTGIHGKTAAFSYENTDGIVSSYDRDLEEKMQELRDKGCENPIEITYQEYDSWNTNRSSSYKKNMVVCGCSFCRGHIDLPVYVFISNAHDPSYDDPSEQVTEMRYSLYAIDKYATAFDGATIEVFCTNPDCPAYDSSNSIEPPRINISIANPECPFCHTDYSSLLDGRRVVDQASVDEARAVTDQCW